MGSYMGQQEHGISDGLYTYKHHREGGADIHVIFVKKSKFRVLLSYIGTMFLLATVCCALLWKALFLKNSTQKCDCRFSLFSFVFSRAGHVNDKRRNSIDTVQLCGYSGSILFMSYLVIIQDSLCLGSLWSISFASIIAKCLRCDPVKKESLVIMPTFGIQLEQHFWSGRVQRKFVPIGKILKPVLNEHVTPVSCYWSLALLLREEYELMLVFKNLNPPLKMLVPIWKELCAFVDSNTLGNSALPQTT